MRLLLQCDSFQTAFAQQLLQTLTEHQDELESAGAAHSGMPLPKLVLSQFRWLEHVADGSGARAAAQREAQPARPACACYGRSPSSGTTTRRMGTRR